MTPIEFALQCLNDVQQALNELDSWDEEERLSEPDYCCSRLLVADIGGRLEIEYRGDVWEEAWEIALRALADERVAPLLAVLRFSGPDHGANGLREMRFGNLLASGCDFPALVDLEFRGYGVADHNQPCVEDGDLIGLLQRCPVIARAKLPQAPAPAFFDLALPHLRRLETGMAHQTHDFILHLSQARGLPALNALDFSDSLAFTLLEPQAEGWDSTPYAHYRQLVDAPFFDQIHVLRLRNARLSEAQFEQLRQRRPQCQFSVALEAPHVYVAHWGTSRFTHRHLLLG